MLLAVIGPGIITSNVDNDPGGITTYSLAGSHYGYGLLWMMIPILIALIVIQEMCVRMAIVTGKGLADLIRENYGIKLTFYMLVALLVHQHVQHHVRVRRSGGRQRTARPVPVLHGAAGRASPSPCSSSGATTGSSSGSSSWPVSSTSPTSSPPSCPSPQWGEIARSTVVPHVQFSSGFLLLAIGLVGTTIAPWMQFYIQASTVEKSIKKEELSYARVDVIVGSIIAVAVAAFIIITCAATLFKAGIKVESAAEAAQALAPLAGRHAETLFAIGLLAAGLFSSGILPLSTSYHVCEGMGWPAGVNHRYGEAKQFYAALCGHHRLWEPSPSSSRACRCSRSCTSRRSATACCCRSCS